MGRSALYGCALIAFVVLLAIAGCGRKTMVVPPETRIPEPVTDLSYSFTEKGVELRWSYPQKTVAGNDLDGMKSFEMWRAEIAVENYCAGCPLPFKKLAKIKAERSPGLGRDRVVHFMDISIRPGYYYLYKVRASTGWLGDGGDSNVIQFVRE